MSLLLLNRECQEIPFFEKSSAHRTAKSNYVVTMLDRVSLLLVCVCSIKGGKGGWCLQQGWQPVRLLTIAQNHVHHSFTSAPCPNKSQIISCASPKLFALYFSSGWFQARIVIFDCCDDNANRHLHLYLRLLFPF